MKSRHTERQRVIAYTLQCCAQEAAVGPDTRARVRVEARAREHLVDAEIFVVHRVVLLALQRLVQSRATRTRTMTSRVLYSASLKYECK